VHQEVEGVLVVIALFADGVEAGDEVGFGEGGIVRFGCG
jgi:hypothetical protein